MVRKGRIYGLLGRNGAGKTTTMRMLLGLTAPSSGDVKIFGKPLRGNEKNILPRIGSLIEAPGFYPNLTGTENLQIFADLRGLKSPKYIKGALEVVNLPYRDKKLFSQYSLGMKQRLAIALAVMHNPELLILDEPTTGLDLGGREIALRALSRVGAEQSDRAVVLVTHRLEEIPQGFDHVAIMGRITGSEADAYADNVAGNDPAPGTIVYSGDLEHGFTSERLSEVFGLDLEVTHANGRWSAYAR